MNEKDYAEALGVELPEAEPVTEPAAEPADTGNTDNDIETNDNGNGGSDNNPGGGGEDPAVDPNASAAARRRAMESRIEREREKAKREARAEMIAEIRRARAANSGNTPPTSNTPPAGNTSPARDAGGRFARRTQGGVQAQPATDLDARIGTAVENHPAVKAAAAFVEQMREQEVQSSFAEDMAKITAMMPELKSEEDIMALPEHDLILDLVSKGYKPSDAVYSVFSDRITASAVERGKRQAEAQAASKSHLIPDKHRGSGGGTGVVVPADVQQMYRDMLPGISDADIAKHYGKYKKIE